MAEILQTVGLVIDVAAVLMLVFLSYAEGGMPVTVKEPTKGILIPLVGWFKDMARRNRKLLVLNVLCVVGLFIGTGLMIAGIWM